MPRFYKITSNRLGFSLLEMVLAISLSSLIIVSTMSFVLVFSNNYLASQQSEKWEREKICYEKFINLSLKDYRRSVVLDRVIEQDLLDNGIFWETRNIQAFEDATHSFIVGIVWQDDHLNFLWTDSAESILTEEKFKRFELFNNVHSVRLMVYDPSNNDWLKENFDDYTLREFLQKKVVCFLKVKYGDEMALFPLFGT